jgi:dihydrolipoamide dehydrogenase
MLVLGAGPGGYSAAFRSADLGMQTVLVERYPTLGGVCLNVGCIPSKALLHITGVMDEAQHMADCGVSFGAPSIDLDRLRAHKDKVVGKLTGGLAGMAKGRKVEVVQGVGQFVDAHHVEVALGRRRQQADPLPESDHRRRLATDRAAVHARRPARRRLDRRPRTAADSAAHAGRRRRHHRPRNGQRLLGARFADHRRRTRGVLMPGADRDLVKVWEKKNAHRFDRILLNTGVVAAAATPEGIEVTYSNDEKERFDLVLVAVGRSPNGKQARCREGRRRRQ